MNREELVFDIEMYKVMERCYLFKNNTSGLTDKERKELRKIADDIDTNIIKLIKGEYEL